MKEKFLGRKTEMSILQKNYDRNGFKMAVIYGRRRIGKTTLINHFIDKQSCRNVSFAAVERGEKELLSMLTESVLTALAPELLGTISFPDFEKVFEFIGNVAMQERVVFFIDEYPYLAKQCPYIQSLLQKIIDYNWKSTNLFFIICGSLVGFMKDEVIGEAAPLHGRSDLELKLRSFDYLETAEFLDGYSFEEKAIVYGLTNGVAKYIRQFDTTQTLEENIIEQFYSIGGYFSEEQVRTVITSDRQNPALYNTIISAIATGHTKNSEIASCAGVNDITYPLKILVKAELIERRMSAKPYYLLNDSMLEFWFKYVNRAASLINAGKGEIYYNLYVKNNIHDFMGKIFEKMARQYVYSHIGQNGIPIITDITDYQRSIVDENGNPEQIELDITGWNGKEILLAGECKFKNSKFDREELEKFLNKTNYLPAKHAVLCLFSLSGFSEYVKNNSEEILLISIEDMYKDGLDG